MQVVMIVVHKLLELNQLNVITVELVNPINYAGLQQKHWDFTQTHMKAHLRRDDYSPAAEQSDSV